MALSGWRIAYYFCFAACQGLTAVYFGIVPKMAVRFSSFESYKGILAGPDGKVRLRCLNGTWLFHLFHLPSSSVISIGGDHFLLMVLPVPLVSLRKP